MVVTSNPDSDAVISNVVEKMIRKSLQIAASQSARIEMKKPRIRTCLHNPDSELCKEIGFQVVRQVAVFRQNFVQIRLDPAMESSFH